MDDENWYVKVAPFFAVPVFFGSWIYCIAHYGFLLGVGLGWLPSLIVAAIAGALWPLIVLAIVAFIILINR